MKKILFLALAGMTTFTACDDWLDLEPENAETAEKFWLTEAGVSSAMTGIYCQWLSSSSYIWQQSEMRADMVMPGSTTSNDYNLVRDGNITSSNGLVAWLTYYSIINQCNLLLDRSHIALANDPSYTVTQDSIYHAEARVVRAMMYFYLIRLWKDVPFITEAYYDDTKNRAVSVSKQMDILNALIGDLEAVQADGILPYAYSAAATDKALNKGQVTMYMLKALLADMYRMKGSYATDLATSQAAYQKCLDLCNTIIQSGQYALVPYNKPTAEEYGVDMHELDNKADSSFYVLSAEPTEWFSGLYGAGNSSESIMELQEDAYNSSGFYNLVVGKRVYYPNTANLTNSLFLPTEKEMAHLYGYQDVRQLFCQGALNGNPVITKFATNDLTTGITDVTMFKKNVLVYRLAEIYLMKAEALTQLAMAHDDDQTMLLEAYRAVFKVRDRAGAVESTDLQLGSGGYMQDSYWEELRKDLPIELKSSERISGRAMEKLVLDEEGRELAYEGRRWFDVLRNAERNAEGKGECTGGNIGYLLNIAGSCTSTDKVAYIAGQFRKPDFRYLPYPYQDVSINGSLDQKPFWGTE